MNHAQNLTVCIVGAGIAGMTAALAFAERGAAVRIVDLDSAPSGSGIDIGASALRMLDQFGVGSRIISEGTSKARFIYTNSAGVDMQDATRQQGEVDEDSVYPVSVTISRLRLARVLRDAALSRGIDLRENCTVTSVVQSDEKVSVDFSDGERGEFDLLIGADGIRSIVRRLVFSGVGEPQFSGQGLWRWILPNPGVTGTGRTYVADDGSSLGVHPLPNGEIYVFMVVFMRENLWIDNEASWRYISQVLDQLHDDDIELVRSALREREDYIYRPLEVFFLEEPWHRGRVALVGDSAHAMTPHLGSGGVMAIEDSLVIAEEIATHSQVSDAFTAFYHRRLDRVRYIYDTSLLLSDLRRNPLSAEFSKYGATRSEAITFLEKSPA